MAKSTTTGSNRVPLSVLDLVPVTSGSTPAEALSNTIDLAQQSEQFGYRRYWLAEHHLNPGVVGASPAVVMSLVASATKDIRVGSAGFQMGHRTALSVVEEVGLIEALNPGRIDLGLGRSAGKPAPKNGVTKSETRAAVPASPSEPSAEARSTAPPAAPRKRPSSLVIPPKFSYRSMLSSPLLALQSQLLQLPGARSQPYAEQVADILSLLHGTYDFSGVHGQASPGEGADVEVWILGSSAGESAHVAGENSLRYAANYHIAPGTVLEAVAAYRHAFQPSPELPAPYLAVSADVVVGETDAAATKLAAGYAPWVRSIRSGAGAIPYPTPAEARKFSWTDEDRELVADRIVTQFVGSARTVAGRLAQLQEATGADELVITTITHDHADRVRSYELLAKEWLG